jgi:hypothetical protein
MQSKTSEAQNNQIVEQTKARNLQRSLKRRKMANAASNLGIPHATWTIIPSISYPNSALKFKSHFAQASLNEIDF